MKKTCHDGDLGFVVGCRGSGFQGFRIQGVGFLGLYGLGVQGLDGCRVQGLGVQGLRNLEVLG